MLKARPLQNFRDILSKMGMQSLSECALWNDACEWYALLNVHQLKDHAPELVNERVQSNKFKL